MSGDGGEQREWRERRGGWQRVARRRDPVGQQLTQCSASALLPLFSLPDVAWHRLPLSSLQLLPLRRPSASVAACFDGKSCWRLPPNSFIICLARQAHPALDHDRLSLDLSSEIFPCLSLLIHPPTGHCVVSAARIGVNLLSWDSSRPSRPGWLASTRTSSLFHLCNTYTSDGLGSGC